MAISLDELNNLAIQAGIDQAARSKLLKEAQELEATKKEEKEANKEPRGKYKYTIVVRGDKDLAAKLAAGFIVKTKDEFDENKIPDVLINAANAHNRIARKNRFFVKTFTDIFQYVKRKTFKAEPEDLQVVTKHAVRVVVLENENAV